MNKYEETAAAIIKECETTLLKIDPESVLAFKDTVLNADKVFFVGVGRVLLSLEAMAKRFAHLGINTYIVGQITEPAITDKDVLIVGSGSGESLFPREIAKKAKSFNVKVIHIGANTDSTIGNLADVKVRIPARTKLYLEDETESIQPMTSLFEQCLLLLGDTVAKMIIDENDINMKELWQYHANLE